MDDLRNHLFATLEALQDEENPMDIARARAISEVAGKLIDSAKVEVEFIRATDALHGSTFLEGKDKEKLTGPRGRDGD